MRGEVVTGPGGAATLPLPESPRAWMGCGPPGPLAVAAPRVLAFLEARRLDVTHRRSAEVPHPTGSSCALSICVGACLRCLSTDEPVSGAH
jgi:hypothetical protein